MIKDFINKWDTNKLKLQESLKTIIDNDELEGFSYLKLVELVIEHIINEEHSFTNLDITKIIVIDHVHYQGTQLYIIPRDTYQPNIEDYYVTHNYYGSCSGCDTLQNIIYTDIQDEQLKELMMLSLHIIQKFKPLCQENER